MVAVVSSMSYLTLSSTGVRRRPLSCSCCCRYNDGGGGRGDDFTASAIPAPKPVLEV